MTPTLGAEASSIARTAPPKWCPCAVIMAFASLRGWVCPVLSEANAMETHVGVGATASLATISRSAGVDDLDAAWWLSSSPVRGGLRYDGATVVLPDAPGLGIEGLVE